MATRKIGIPYAESVFDEDGHGIQCPFCPAILRDVDETQETAEDAITKGASMAYALHYEAEHPGEEL